MIQDPLLAWLFVVLLIVAIWVVVCWLVSWAGGWRQLAEAYPRGDSGPGTTWRFQSATLRWGMSYNNGLRVTATPDGVGVSVLPLFRIGHPPLFFPWSEISIRRREKSFGTEWVTLAFERVPPVSFTVRGTLVQKIEEVVGRPLEGRAA
jgi:hypothetical protein